MQVADRSDPSVPTPRVIAPVGQSTMHGSVHWQHAVGTSQLRSAAFAQKRAPPPCASAQPRTHSRSVQVEVDQRTLRRGSAGVHGHACTDDTGLCSAAPRALRRERRGPQPLLDRRCASTRGSLRVIFTSSTLERLERERQGSSISAASPAKSPVRRHVIASSEVPPWRYLHIAAAHEEERVRGRPPRRSPAPAERDEPAFAHRVDHAGYVLEQADAAQVPPGVPR